MGRPRSTSTHCKNGHEFTEENTYIHPNTYHRACKKCRRKCVDVYTEENRETVNVSKRNRRKALTKEDRRRDNLKQIGWTLESFSNALAEQKGLCGICGIVLTFEDKAGRTRANADHEHCIPPKPRGVLCGNCNIGIGNLQDSIEILKKAVAYLEKYA
jgi:hypothetical protein